MHTIMICYCYLTVLEISIKNAFGDDSMSEAQIKLWYQYFKDGCLRLLAFPKAKITVEREEICECDGHTVQKLSR